MNPSRLAVKLLLLVVLCVGCAVPVASNLDEEESSRIVVALTKSGIDGTKEPDPVGEGKWRVTVAHDDVPSALGVMKDERLPRTEPGGVLDSVSKGSLVPSEAAEHAQLVAGMAGELERSLESIDGVLNVRVHLNLPVAPGSREAPATKSSASVLLEHQGSTPPLTSDAVQRLVAGGCPALTPADVTVVMVSHPAPARVPGAELSHVGPIAVAHASRRFLQILLVVLVAVAGILALVALLFYRRFADVRDQNAVLAAAAAKK